MSAGKKASKLILLGALTLLVGCRRAASVDSYIPATDAARAALETALETWRSGEEHGPITSSQPEINMFDSRWQAGEKLASFEILEEVTGEQHRQFRVKLQREGQPEETLNYLVIGIDPLLVFRDADYQKTTGM